MDFGGGEIQGFHWKSPDIAAVNPFLRKWGGANSQEDFGGNGQKGLISGDFR